MLVKVEKIAKQEVTVVSSLDMVETFEKRHDHVMRDIENLKKDIPNFWEMFFETSAPDSYNRERKIYNMNRDGFILLVMGYTGEKAMKFKLAYIKQFNAMEKVLQGKYVEREKVVENNTELTKVLRKYKECFRESISLDWLQITEEWIEVLNECIRTGKSFKETFGKIEYEEDADY